MTCNKCQLIRINGVIVHEIGCPNQDSKEYEAYLKRLERNRKKVVGST